MEYIPEEKRTKWGNMQTVYWIVFSLFTLANLHGSYFNQDGYFIFIILIFSVPASIFSLLLIWITKLLVKKNENIDYEENTMAYWTTYTFSLLFLIVPIIFYFIIIS